MKPTLRLSAVLFFFVSVEGSLPVVFAAPPAVVPDEQDRQVIEAVLLRLHEDQKFGVWPQPHDGPKIILHDRTPDKIGMIQSHQIRNDIREHKVPEDLLRALWERNKGEGEYDGIPASFKELKFDKKIKVADLSGKTGSGYRSEFEKAHPDARGWARAFLPGYSKDGLLAVFRASVGPSHHGAVVTAMLEKTGGKWSIKWHHVSYYV